MKKDTISVGMWLAIGFVVAGLFIGTAVVLLGDMQGGLLSFLKSTENY